MSKKNKDIFAAMAGISITEKETTATPKGEKNKPAPTGERVKTSVFINSEIWKKFKVAAVEQGVSVSSKLEMAMLAELGNR